MPYRYGMLTLESVMKLPALGLATCLSLCSAGASAAVQLDLSTGSAGFFNTPQAGLFNDYFEFELLTPVTLVGSVTSVVNGGQNIDFYQIAFVLKDDYSSSLEAPSSRFADFNCPPASSTTSWLRRTGSLCTTWRAGSGAGPRKRPCQSSRHEWVAMRWRSSCLPPSTRPRAGWSCPAGTRP